MGTTNYLNKLLFTTQAGNTKTEHGYYQLYEQLLITITQAGGTITLPLPQETILLFNTSVAT